MIEVHIVHTPEHDPPLHHVMRLLRQEPVRVRVVKGQAGRLGAARAEAIAAAQEPWVSWVDPDDEIVPGLYRVLTEALDHEYSLIHTWEWVHPLHGGRPFLNKAPHHGVAVRREAALPLLDTVARMHHGAEQPLLALQPRKTIEWPGYRWRRRVGSMTIPVDRKGVQG